MKPEVLVAILGMLILVVSFFLPVNKIEDRVWKIALSSFSSGMFVTAAIYTFLK